MESQLTFGYSEVQELGAGAPGDGRLHLVVLGSGSKGNAAAIVGNQGALLIDAGFSKKETLRRLALAGIDPAEIKAILVTHEHSDHIKGLGVMSRGLKVPVYASRGTVHAPSLIREAPAAVEFSHSGTLTLAGIDIITFPTSHDAADPVGFRFEQAGDAIGYATDTGYLTGAAQEALRDVRVLALESNHDPEMLRTGPYPYILKRRIASDSGHLSNMQSAQGLQALLSNRLECVVGMHLSETNNLHELSESALGEVIAREDHPALAGAAWQNRPTIAW